MKILTILLSLICGAANASQISVTSTPHGTQFHVGHDGGVLAITAAHVSSAQRRCGKHSQTWNHVAGRDIAWRSILDDECTARSGSLPELGDLCTVVTQRGRRVGQVIAVDADGFQMDSKLCRGESGSPVLNAAGEVVGVAVAHGCPGNVCGRPSFHEAFALAPKKSQREPRAEPRTDRPRRAIRVLPKRAKRAIGRATKPTRRSRRR